MSEATTLRYERMTQNKSLAEALNRQKERVRSDEQLTRDVMEMKLEETNTLRSMWEENLELKLGFRHAKGQHQMKLAETRLAKTASLAVRRAALKQLFENEYARYENELRAVGKAFHIQRV